MRGSATATKERIKEIKFVKEDFNVEKLIRNKTTSLASTTSNYLRTSIITSRSIEVARTPKKEEIENKVEKEQEEIETKKEQKEKNENKNENKVTKKIEKVTDNKKTDKKNKTAKTTKRKEDKKEEKKVKKEETKKIEQDEETKSIGKIKVSISKGMDLTKRTGLSKEQFKKLIKNVPQDSSKFFYNNADTIYDLCANYQINEIFFCGLISAESGWNIAGNHITM